MKKDKVNERRIKASQRFLIKAQSLMLALNLYRESPQTNPLFKLDNFALFHVDYEPKQDQQAVSTLRKLQVRQGGRLHLSQIIPYGRPPVVLN